MGNVAIVEIMGMTSVVIVICGLTAWTIIKITQIKSAAGADKTELHSIVAKQDEQIDVLRKRLENIESIVVEQEKHNEFEKAL